MNKIFCNICLLNVLVQIFIIQGCAETSHSIIAATETTIGVNISQNPATDSPQAKLGYNRAELAIVPTNRSKSKEAGTVKNGAKDVADVLMELRYGGIFDTGSTSGIYQRLAVGSTAVIQPGADVMFAKDSAGIVSNNSVAALNAVKAVPVQSESVLKEKRKLADAYRNIKHDRTLNDVTRQNRLSVFTDAARNAGYSITEKDVSEGKDEFMIFLSDTHTDYEKVSNIKKSIESKGVTIP